MAGKRLLDLAAIFNASRGVAQKHVALRTRQVDVYNRTSTLARAVRNQTDRITETVKAASFLASRLNEDAPSWASDTADERKAATSHDGETIPRKKTTEGEPAAVVKDGLEQDHHYDRSPANSPLNPPPEGELEIQQEKANRYPLPDGTIPPAEIDERAAPIDDDVVPIRPQDEPHKKPLKNEGLEPASSGASTIPLPDKKPLPSKSARVAQLNSEFQIPSKTADAYDGSSTPLREGHDEETFNKRSTHTSPELSSLPRVKIPKHPSNTQGTERPANKTLNSDTFYTGSSESAVYSEQEEIPEGVNTAVFHSSKIARSLGGRIQGGRVGLEKPQTSSIPKDEIDDLAKEISQEADKHSKVEASPEPPPYELRESKVPSSRLGRIWNYGGLAAGMFGGAISESIRRVSGSGGEGSYMLSAGNMERLVTKLSRMRGAALKLGQMISFQDSKMLPAPIQEVLQRVQDRADYMPPSQRDKVLTANLGSEWRELFSSFEEKPIAAASIGQVHKAVLKSNGAPVAVKVQYPGVADSIDSDLNNLATLLTASRLLPKGLFLDKTIANARTELAWECDYIREAECGQRFQELLADEKDVFIVPKVYSEASGKQVLTMEFLDGVGVTRVKSFTQEQRDWIGTQILRLCLREITEFKYMQTDPNWTNFLYNAQTNKLELLDFGASREYPEEFITRYTRLLAAASVSDKKTVKELSIELGYLTGHESKAMLDAHIASILTLAEPFLESSPEIYDFKDQTITERVKALIPVMIRERLAPPPEETYSLHRKLSGAFLLCARLGSRVRCREMFTTSMEKVNIL
ncbi:Protein ABC1-like protein, mitochondrial [Lachnellula willkommii]|uniref:Protein ABC1-like protein, mitochondrial n=1 Tax=Lachnellula willkommii TaxID=215461 RepID=A0A559M5J4_9HELO|nr:Protein ABC1-like protein, mitochondrial [Lachnellula willkommii]